jgi:ATP-dependent Clp endopeptidase proteolytic subunit ClpP
MTNLVQIVNKSGKVKLTDAVTPWSVEKLTDDISKLFGASASEHQDFTAIINAGGEAVDTLEIEINSPGGSIFDGYNIYREIKSLQERGVIVTATITGMAASMASVIAMAADRIQMVPHGRMMIHEASQGVRGNAEELRKAADLLDGISNDIAVIYSERTGKPLDDIRTMMKAETWMNATEALQNGFIDGVFDIRPNVPTKKAMNLIEAIKSILPSVNTDDADKLVAHVAEVETLSADLVSAEAKITELQNLAAVVAEKDLEISNLTAAAAAYQADIVAKVETITTLQADLTQAQADIEAAKASAGEQAIEVLASIGQPEPLAECELIAPVNHAESFAKLTGKERTEYYAKHGAEIRASLTK